MNFGRICLCKEVLKEEVEEAAKHGCFTVEDIQQRLDAGTSCGNCIPEIQEIINQAKEILV